MKKKLIGSIAATMMIIAATAAYGQLRTHSVHTWVKKGQMNGSNGTVICTCECGIGGETKQTTGYGSCSC